MSEDLLSLFIKVSDDRAPGHMDDEHARRLGFPRRLIHGFLVGCGYSRILGMFLPGGDTVIHKLELEMIAPVYLEDVIEYEVAVGRVVASVKTVILNLSAVNQNGVVVNRGRATCVFRRP